MTFFRVLFLIVAFISVDEALAAPAGALGDGSMYSQSGKVEKKSHTEKRKGGEAGAIIPKQLATLEF